MYVSASIFLISMPALFFHFHSLSLSFFFLLFFLSSLDELLIVLTVFSFNSPYYNFVALASFDTHKT